MPVGFEQDGKASVAREIVVVALLLAAPLAVYWPVLHYPFVDLDDQLYVFRNSQVLGGLTGSGVAWAFRSLGYAGNWHPLTWISHMLDVQLFGLNAGGHHLSSLALHVASTLALYFVLRSYTGAAGRSAVVAALFAVHPLHVESVAWVAERKDVLSAFFWVATLAAYLAYVRSPAMLRYLLVAGFFSLGLLSKPMVVTLPIAMLLLDYWPLGRWRRGAALILEKVPFLALSVASSFVTVIAQYQGGAMKGAGHHPLALRLANALTSCAAYLRKAVLPTDLAVYYPFPQAIPVWQWSGAAALLIALTTVALFGRRSHPCLPVGWFWYLATLLPVIGIVHVGGQAMADRYLYLPSVGLFTAAVWGVHQAAALLRRRGAILAAAAMGCLVPLAVSARNQVHSWSGTAALAENALSVTTGNWAAHGMLASFFLRQGNDEEAIAHARAAIAINDFAGARDILGVALTRLGRADEGIAQLREAIRIDPGFFSAHNDLAVALEGQGRVMEALEHYRTAAQLQPDAVEVLDNLGSALLRTGNPVEAMHHLTTALRLAPGAADVHFHAAVAFEMQRRFAEAARHYQEVLRLAPADAEARAGLQRVLSGR